ncbi:MAG: S1C family serine protease [Acidimicrobiales bacterium]
MVEPGNDFEDSHEEEPYGALLPQEDRLWRHPSELYQPTTKSREAQALAARRRWLASTPSRAGAGAAGLVGALLATGLVLIGTHLTSWLTPREGAGQTTSLRAALQSATSTTTTLVHVAGLGPVLGGVKSAIVRVLAVSQGNTVEADGALISPAGYVVTAAAAIAGATSVSVIRSDGEQLIATVVGRDSATGLAVLHIDGSGLPSIKLSTTSAQGADTMAITAWQTNTLHLMLAPISAPLGTASLGNGPMLLERCPPSLGLAHAPVGALIIDARGQITGMVTGQGRLVTIATPGWLVARITAALISQRRVTHGWLGIEGRTARSPAGVRVIKVDPQSAASAAGISRGDVIQSVDGKPIASMAGLQALLYLMAPTTTVRFTVIHGNQKMEVSTRLKSAA